MNGPARPYVQTPSRAWWLSRPSYRRYMLRELTCVWIGAYVVALVVGLVRLFQGAAAWEAYLHALRSVPGLVFQATALAFVLYHAVTWFALAPSTMPIWRNGKRMPPAWIHAAHYLVWIVISTGVLWSASR